MTMSEEDQHKLINEVGYEAFQLIIRRMEALGSRSFADIFAAVVGASTVCFANALRPGIEKSSNPSVAADDLIAAGMKRVRSMVEPAVRARNG